MKLPLTVAACCVVQSFAAPEGLWRFENPPGFLNDSSRNSRHLANEGEVEILTSGGPGPGRAAALSGSNRLTAADAAVWHAPKFTIEVYFRATATSTGATQVIVSHHNNTGNQRGWHLAEAGSKLRFAKSTNGSGLASVDSFTLTAGTDYYAAAILDAEAGTVRMVLRNLTAGGAPVSELRTIAAGGPFEADAPFSIGATGTLPAGSSFFKGVIDDVRFTASSLPTGELLEPFTILPDPPPVADRTKVDGYRGIWFKLGQVSAFGDKYSGGLGTYTVNHRPMAVYSAAVNKTFFTYGGTSGPPNNTLWIMAGEYDHATHAVTRPTRVMDKSPVNDPHDNGCITMDDEGYVWVFVSGRSNARKGFTYRSAEPYSVDGFVRTSPAVGETYTYPQIWHDSENGFFHLFTIYNGNQRELFFRTSPDGYQWSGSQPIAKLQGSYQASGRVGKVIGTFFNRHPGGSVDARTDLYYMQTVDWGRTWTTAAGEVLTVPLTAAANPARVFNYSAIGRLMYGIDIAFDENQRPVLFYLTSKNFQPGPDGEPRTLHTARWTGSEWIIRDMPPSATNVSSTTHNYAAGSLWIENRVWNIIAPTGSDQSLLATNPNRFWGHGGELERWTSTDEGLTWTKVRAVTENSARKHGYVRKPQDGAGRFFTYWADGNPEVQTESHLYFGTADGARAWELPYQMTAATAKPVEVNPPFLRWQRGYFDPAEISDPSVGGADADEDGDGRSNLIEYAQGTNPRMKDDARLIPEVMEDGLGKFLKLSYRKNLEAHDLLQRIESSDDMEFWEDVEEMLFGISAVKSGAVEHLSRGHRGTSGLPGNRRFYRMKVEFDR